MDLIYGGGPWTRGPCFVLSTLTDTKQIGVKNPMKSITSITLSECEYRVFSITLKFNLSIDIDLSSGFPITIVIERLPQVTWQILQKTHKLS